MELGARTIAINCIEGYQRYISPHKGFCCAHRALHNGASCSEWAKLAIRKVGVLNALPIMFRRFKACTAAYKEILYLSETAEKEEDENQLNNNPFSDKLGCCLDCMPCLPISLSS